MGAAGGGSVASLAANVAVAEPTATGRVIAAWPSFALIAAYELLMRQVRCAAGSTPGNKQVAQRRSVMNQANPARPFSSAAPLPALHSIGLAEAGSCNCRRGSGHWLTGQVTARFPPARPSPVSTAGRSAGAARQTGWT